MPVNMKLMIASAFVQMAKRKQIDKITVKDLVEECGISRQAFYYHFQDILEVMEWSVRQIIQQALQNSLYAPSPEKAIEEFIRVSADQQELLSKLLNSRRREQVESIFVEAMRSSIQQVLHSKKPELALNHQELDVALNFYAYGTAGVVFENCKSGSMDAEQLARKLYQLISGSLIKF